MTNVAGSTTGDIEIFDTNGPVSSWTAHTCTMAASANWIAESIEIIVPPITMVDNTNLIQASGGMTNYDGGSNSCGAPGSPCLTDRFDTTGAGNSIIAKFTYTYSATRTITVKDSAGDTLTQYGKCDDSGGGLTSAIYYISGATPSTSLNVTFDAAVPQFQPAYAEIKGSITAVGTMSCNIQLSPALGLNNVTDATGVTTTGANQMVVSFTDNEQSPFQFGQQATDIQFTNGYTGLYAETQIATAGEIGVQATAATVKPSFTFVAPSYDQWILVTGAFSLGGGGTARQWGHIIRKQQGIILASPTSQYVTYPCTAGNMIFTTFENNTGSGGHNITAIVDKDANTWASQIPGGTNYAQFWNATNATCSGNDIWYMTNTNTGARTRFPIYEIPNALTSSAIDVASETSATYTSAALTTLAAAITSSTQTSLTLAAGGGITANQYLTLGTGVEVVQCMAGCGTTTITVTRGASGTVAQASVASATSVYATLQPNAPSVTTGSANEIIFAGMNQGNGPNEDTLNCTYDFGWFNGLTDGNYYANGDGTCHQYMPSAGTNNIGWYLVSSNPPDTAYTNAEGVKLQAQSSSTVRRRAWVLDQ